MGGNTLIHVSREALLAAGVADQKLEQVRGGALRHTQPLCQPLCALAHLLLTSKIARRDTGRVFEWLQCMHQLPARRDHQQQHIVDVVDRMAHAVERHAGGPLRAQRRSRAVQNPSRGVHAGFCNTTTNRSARLRSACSARASRR